MSPDPLTPKHPAKYSEEIVRTLDRLVRAEARAVGSTAATPLAVLDPFAGVGRVHRLRRPNVFTAGIEIEPEWAGCHPDTLCDDSLAVLPHMAASGVEVDVVATSPTYGNRMADHHDARDGSRRRSYKHDLGRMPAPGSSSTLPWGPDYWAFHVRAYRAIYGVLRPGGLFLLNVSDFYRRKQIVPAVEWHRGAAMGAGFVQGAGDVHVGTPRLRGVGSEATAARAATEVVLRLRRPKEEA